MGMAVDDDRDMETLDDIADELGVSPEDLVEGTTQIPFEEIEGEIADRAQLCRCAGCGKIIGCEYEYCPNCR